MVIGGLFRESWYFRERTNASMDPNPCSDFCCNCPACGAPGSLSSFAGRSFGIGTAMGKPMVRFAGDVICREPGDHSKFLSEYRYGIILSSRVGRRCSFLLFWPASSVVHTGIMRRLFLVGF